MSVTKRVLRVLIKGNSGYGPIDEAYKDKLTIERSGIRYDYVPLIPSEGNLPLKWSYRTTNPKFECQFCRLAELMPDILDMPDERGVTDVGSIEFSVTYVDGSKSKRLFWLTAESFTECFAIVRRMLPSFEDVPHVLR